MRHTTPRLARTLLSGLAAVLLTGTTAANPQNARFSGICSFGDSLSDIGSFYAATGYTLPSLPYFEGRFCDGPIWIDYLATLLERPLEEDRQFAIGGATSGAENFRSMPPTFLLPGFQQQIETVLAKDDNGRLDPRGLYTIWIGANDFFAWLGSGNPDPSAMIAGGVANTIGGITALADAGATNFVVINLPDLGRTPAARDLPPGVDGLLSVLSANYNQLLDQQLDLLEDQRPNLKIVRISAFELINHMIANPEDYGFTNVTDPALSSFPAVNPDEHLFWDGVHPTSAAQQVVAETVYAGISQEFPIGWNTISGEELHRESVEAVTRHGKKRSLAKAGAH